MYIYCAPVLHGMLCRPGHHPQKAACPRPSDTWISLFSERWQSVDPASDCLGQVQIPPLGWGGGVATRKSSPGENLRSSFNGKGWLEQLEIWVEVCRLWPWSQTIVSKGRRGGMQGPFPQRDILSTIECLLPSRDSPPTRSILPTTLPDKDW